MIKAVIFDFDGVVVNNEPLHRQAERQALLRCGVRINDAELEQFRDCMDDSMFGELVKRYSLRCTAEYLSAEKMKIYRSLMDAKAPVADGIPKLLEKLKLRNMKIGLTTRTPSDVVLPLLKKYKLHQFFDAIVTANDITTSKPSTEVYQRAASRLETKPEHCLVIEDCGSAIDVVKQIGMYCIGFKNLHTGNEDLSKSDLIISSIRDTPVQKFVEIDQRKRKKILVTA